MATRNPRARTAAPRAAAPASVVNHRLTIEYMDINDIVPYEWNPRQNAEAVASVAASIKLTQGFAMPVVVDANNVLVAGHTRVEAAKSLGMTEVPAVRLDHLSPEAINAFRVVDNKVSEQAKWDHELLAGEIGKLESAGITWTDFGWSQGEIDCMAQLVADDCLNTSTLAPVAEEAAASATRNASSRAPSRARFVMGEIVFYLDIGVYRPWVTGIRELCGFDEQAIAAEIMRRLGITD